MSRNDLALDSAGFFWFVIDGYELGVAWHGHHAFVRYFFEFSDFVLKFFDDFPFIDQFLLKLFADLAQLLDGAALFLIDLLPVLELLLQPRDVLLEFIEHPLIFGGDVFQLFELLEQELVFGFEFLILLLFPRVLHLEREFVIDLLHGVDQRLGEAAANEGVFAYGAGLRRGVHPDHRAVLARLFTLGVIQEDLFVLLGGKRVLIDELKLELLVLHFVELLLVAKILYQLVDLDKGDPLVPLSLHSVVGLYDHLEELHRAP